MEVRHRYVAILILIPVCSILRQIYILLFPPPLSWYSLLPLFYCITHTEANRRKKQFNQNMRTTTFNRRKILNKRVLLAMQYSISKLLNSNLNQFHIGSRSLVARMHLWRLWVILVMTLRMQLCLTGESRRYFEVWISCAVYCGALSFHVERDDRRKKVESVLLFKSIYVFIHF